MCHQRQQKQDSYSDDDIVSDGDPPSDSDFEPQTEDESTSPSQEGSAMTISSPDCSQTKDKHKAGPITYQIDADNRLTSVLDKPEVPGKAIQFLIQHQQVLKIQELARLKLQVRMLKYNKEAEVACQRSFETTLKVVQYQSKILKHIEALHQAGIKGELLDEIQSYLANLKLMDDPPE
ncbi:hypothetical protein M422DRAFT_50948 [Sphaerobolus stellatus SS14]|uniref:Uncharacterized protein n=1 Tax=Sphaerobolus stellatus (strain SS14) TaxID=990650 RepID=A0A0C9VH06_SPHS4|nr:hypothetical protein M422DRAFT_50948 [Sphaerobolus stellatus SS14]